ncbi:hypothetical protein MUK42_32872 [Musa troglodytarum]|uniref:Uncharacterized protein n=1 Tax=Musa troglodytarum TaxID=320322 RepID=A0A9E7F3G4_9LILI|nr:hypothetical protein MUK42_32872 [Musa troglodytarum]
MELWWMIAAFGLRFLAGTGPDCPKIVSLLQKNYPENNEEALKQAKPCSKVHADSDATTAPIKQSIIEMEEKELQDQWMVDCPRRILTTSQKLRSKGGRIHQD